jgi:UMF1 family MFS transporter
MSLPRSVRSWAFYDFANSSYVLIYSSFLLPVFFTTVLAGRGLTLSSWGWANGISTLLGVIGAVIVGYFADHHSRLSVFRKSVIAAFVGMVAVALAVQYFVDYLYIIFIATNALFILSVSLSDSILPYLGTTSKDPYHYGGFAWGFGYIGGVASLIIVLILQRFTSEYSSLVFLSVAIFYLVFSFYSLRGLKNVALNEPPAQDAQSLITKSQKIILFLGYWLISECITVVILFFSIFANRELKLSSAVIGVFLLVVQLVAFPATWYGGYLSKRYNPLSLLGLTIIFWGATIGLLVSHPSIWTMIAVTILGGFAVGNSQSYLRSQYATLINRSESGFQFGIYAIVSEAAVFIGPIMYGYASDHLHSQRVPLMGLFVLMVLGYALVRLVVGRVKIQSQAA